MHRELAIERRGEHFLLRFHDYMGPWEGHQIEQLLDLEEIPTPSDTEHDAEVLGANQCYLWHAMGFDPELHALVTEDRLVRVAQIVRDREVEVTAGADLLPAPPPERLHLDPGHGPSATSYVDLIEERHRSPWQRGPKAFVTAALVRIVPLVVVVYAIIIFGRHTGDHFETVGLAEVFQRAQEPVAEQNLWERWTNPDRSHEVRHEIRRILYASGSHMIVGDGSFLEFAGVRDVMPWVRQVQMRSAPLVIDAISTDGTVRVQEVRCGSEVLADRLELRRVARFAPSTQHPRREDAPGAFRTVEAIPEGAEDESLEGAAVSLTGSVVDREGRRVLRTQDDHELLIELAGSSLHLETFLDAIAGTECPVQIDAVLSGLGEAPDGLLGTATVHSASAGNYHVVGRRLATR